MNRYCSRLYRKVCLEINSGLTTKEKEELLFYCRDVLPDAVTENSSILTTLTELQRRRILLFEDTSFLRQFLEDIERLDLLSKVEAFDVSRELVWLFESVMSSKIRRKFCHGPFDVGNGDDGNRLLSDFVKHQDVSDRIGRLTVAARRQLKEKEQEGSGIANITSILVDFRWEIIENSDSKQMTWQLIPPLIKFASELAISNYTNGCTVDVGEKIVVSICNQLVKDVLPWIIKNGGWSAFQAFVVEETRIERSGRCQDESKSEAYRFYLEKAAGCFHKLVHVVFGVTYQAFVAGLAYLPSTWR